MTHRRQVACQYEIGFPGLQMDKILLPQYMYLVEVGQPG